jgi:hypothetical protein
VIYNLHTDGFPKDAVFIARPGKWGNPFVIGKHGDRAEVIAKYRTWLWEKIRAGDIRADEVAALEGRDLVCYCAPKPCHGSVLQHAAFMLKYVG